MPAGTRTRRNAEKSPHPAFANGPQDPVRVKAMRLELGFSRKQFARMVAASERAVAAWENDHAVSPVVGKALREAERLCRALMNVMKAERLGAWLDTPNEAFGGLKPLDLIERGESDRLWRMIFEVESGALS